MWYFVTEQSKTLFGHYDEELWLFYWLFYYILKTKRLMIYQRPMV